MSSKVQEATTGEQRRMLEDMMKQRRLKQEVAEIRLLNLKEHIKNAEEEVCRLDKAVRRVRLNPQCKRLQENLGKLVKEIPWCQEQFDRCWRENTLPVKPLTFSARRREKRNSDVKGSDGDAKEKTCRPFGNVTFAYFRASVGRRITVAYEYLPQFATHPNRLPIAYAAVVFHPLTTKMVDGVNVIKRDIYDPNEQRRAAFDRYTKGKIIYLHDGVSSDCTKLDHETLLKVLRGLLPKYGTFQGSKKFCSEMSKRTSPIKREIYIETAVVKGSKKVSSSSSA